MFPLKINGLIERPPATHTRVAPAQPRPPLADHPKLAPGETVMPVVDRRRNGNRRTQDRREKQQVAFLDTRVPQGRRHSGGRRAEDRQGPDMYRPISIKA